MGEHLEHATQARLALRAQQGDLEARRLLMETNQALIAHWAKRYRGRGVELEDLMQEGQVGMMKAIDRFNPGRGARFATYATLWIRQALGRACEKQGSVERFGMRLPSEVCNAFPRIDDPESSSFAVEQARRMSQQGKPKSLDSGDPELMMIAGSGEPSAPLVRMLLSQSCGHLEHGFQPEVLALKGCQMAARAWAGALDEQSWWLVGRDAGRPWRLELLLGEELHPLDRGVGALADRATDRLLSLCDDLPLLPADSCTHCV